MDNYSFKILRLFSKRDALSLSQLSAILDASDWGLAEPVSYLRKHSFLRIESNFAALHDLAQNATIDPNTPMEITFEGKVALEAEAKSRRQLTFNEIRAWITAIIAVAAFVKSFFF